MPDIMAEGAASGDSSMDGSITSSPRKRSSQNEELKHMIMCVRMELESTRAAAKAESEMHNAKVEQLEDLLRAAMRERDEAVHKLIEIQSSSSAISSCSLPAASFIADSPLDSFNDQSDWFTFPTAFDCVSPDVDLLAGQPESMPVSVDYSASPSFEAALDPIMPTPPPAAAYFDSASRFESASNSCLQNGSALASILTPLEQKSTRNNSGSRLESSSADAEMSLMLKNLPERGRLLQAVMQAGPLLHTLLLAGPLPQWHRPPPGLDAFQFPSLSGSLASASSLEQQQQKSSVSDDTTMDCFNSQRKRRLVQNHKNLMHDSGAPHAQVC